MDRPRTGIKRRALLRRLGLGAGLLVVLALTLGLARLRPAAPRVDRSAVWIDTVKRGPMVRQVRGLGTLVPEDVRWIPAPADARVERILVHPGTTVAADTVLLELSNPELELAALEAESQARAAEAQYAETDAQLQALQLERESAAARVESEYEEARLHADTDAELARQGLIAGITLKLSQLGAHQAEKRQGLEVRRLEKAAVAAQAQLAALRAVTAQRQAAARLRRSQVQALGVSAGLGGVLQQMEVEVGQRVAAGTALAKVAEPTHLKAVVRVAETQAKDVQIGQEVQVDTRNGVIAGRVARVDPAVQNGTVTVDVRLTGPLPAGARPDLTIDGTIELERLADVVYVGRSAQAQPEAALTMYCLDPGGAGAHRVRVQLGRASVSAIEVRSGLQPGQQVILSDTAPFDSADSIRLQ